METEINKTDDLSIREIKTYRDETMDLINNAIKQFEHKTGLSVVSVHNTFGVWEISINSPV